jgi:2'-hydroxyisoflavone reductase
VAASAVADPGERRLLLIGGTQFVGRHLVDAAIAAGWRVTLFNRGITRADLPARVEHCKGDRKSDLSPLSTPPFDGRRWDVVIDCCGYLPRDVAAMADALAGRVGRYVFISSVSVYADFAQPNNEASPLGRIDDVDTDVVDGRTYGPLKALCESALTERFGADALLIRPGLVVGPFDPTQRFTWWPARLAQAVDGEPLLVPNGGRDPVQFVDARDLAAFVLRAIERGERGPFNVVSPAGQWRLADVIDASAQAAGTSPPRVAIGHDELVAAGVAPWNDVPLWFPPAGEQAAVTLTDTTAAQAAGLTIRPLSATVQDTLAWWRSLPADQQAFTKAGLSRDRERSLLKALG